MDQQMGGMSSDLSPKGIGDILGAVFDTYKKHWQTLMTIVAIFAIPVQIIQFYVVDQLILKPLNTAALSDVQSLSDLNEAVGGTFYRSLWAFGVGNLIITVLSFVLMAAITKAAADDIVGLDRQHFLKCMGCPMGLESLTTLKFVLYGNGQIRE